MYLDVCRASIQRLTAKIYVDEETAYNMIRMTAMLMDLPLEDERVVDMILRDCGVA